METIERMPTMLVLEKNPSTFDAIVGLLGEAAEGWDIIRLDECPDFLLQQARDAITSDYELALCNAGVLGPELALMLRACDTSALTYATDYTYDEGGWTHERLALEFDEFSRPSSSRWPIALCTTLESLAEAAAEVMSLWRPNLGDLPPYGGCNPFTYSVIADDFEEHFHEMNERWAAALLVSRYQQSGTWFAITRNDVETTSLPDTHDRVNYLHGFDMLHMNRWFYVVTEGNKRFYYPTEQFISVLPPA